MVGLRESTLKLKVLRRLESIILRVVNANIIFHKTAILLMFQADPIESMLYTIYKLLMLGVKKTTQIM